MALGQIVGPIRCKHASINASNTSGSQTQTVACKNATGQTVDDSLCPAQSKPSSVISCTNFCVGVPLTSQSCTYIPL